MIICRSAQAGVTLIDTVSVMNQARKCVWNKDGTYFGIANKNGFVGFDEVQIWRVNYESYSEPDQQWDFPGDMVLDYGWSDRYLAICGYDDDKTVVVYDILEDNSWYDNEVKSFDIDNKCHQLEWAHGWNFLICESLNDIDDPDDSDLVVYDCSSNNHNEWFCARKIDTPFEADKFEMHVNGDWLSYESNEEDYNNYKVHIWDISGDPFYWKEKYVKDDRRGGSFSPSGIYFITEHPANDNVYIYRTDDGKLMKRTSIVGDGPVFHPKSIGLSYGFIGLTVDSSLTVIDMCDWSIAFHNLSINSGGCSFNPNGNMVSVYEKYSGDVCGIYRFDYNTNYPDELRVVVQPNPFDSFVDLYFYACDMKFDFNIYIYNVNGQLIKNYNSIRHKMQWDGKNNRGIEVSSGVYFCRIFNQRTQKTVKLIKLN